MQVDQYTRQKLFVGYGHGFHAVGDYVVDILNENNIRVHRVEVTNQRAVSTGAEKDRTVRLAEGLILQIHGNRVGRRLLRTERDIVLYTVTTLICRYDTPHQLLEECLMLRRNGQVDVHTPRLIACVECTLHEVLLECRPRTVSRSVEKEQSLRQFAIVHPARLEQVSDDSLIPPRGDQLMHAHSLIGAACSVERTEEGERVNLVEEGAFEVRRRTIRRGGQECEEVLEHPAGCTRGRNEFENVGIARQISVPTFNVLGKLFIGHYADTVSRSCGGHEGEKWKAVREACQLFIQLGFGDFLIGQMPNVV